MGQDRIELEFLQAFGQTCVLFGYRDVTITVWHGTAEESAVQFMDEVSGARSVHFPRGVSGVHLVMHDAGMPTAGARSALAASARKWSGQTAAVAVVIEQAGFFGSAMRSAITGIQLLSKAAFPIKVFADTSTAAGWLTGPHAERTGTALDLAQFDAALQRARTIKTAPPAARSSIAR